MTYGVEIITMTKKQQENFRIQERKMLKRTLGPIKVSEGIEEKTTAKLTNYYKRILKTSQKEQRIKQLGLVRRAGPNATIEAKWEPLSRRRR